MIANLEVTEQDVLDVMKKYEPTTIEELIE